MDPLETERSLWNAGSMADLTPSRAETQRKPGHRDGQTRNAREPISARPAGAGYPRWRDHLRRRLRLRRSTASGLPRLLDPSGFDALRQLRVGERAAFARRPGLFDPRLPRRPGGAAD